MDEVSRRSGVAKTTIYRHWPSRESLLLAACSQLSSRPAVPDSGKLRTDLETLAAGDAMRLQQPWSTVLPSIIDAAERDKDLAELQSRIHAQMRRALTTVIERAQDRGELPRSHDAREPLDESFAKRVVERALRNAG